VADVVRDGEVRELDLSLLEPAPPGMNFFSPGKEEELAELARSMAEVGLINPLVVRPLPGGTYQVLAGHRRLRAAQLLGWRSVRCQVRDLPDEEAELVLIDSNLLARELNPLEKAECVRRRVQLKQVIRARQRELALRAVRFERGLEENPVPIGTGKNGISDSMLEVARELGMSRADVARNVKVAEFLAPCWRDVFARGDLALRTAYELAFLCPDEQEEAYRRWFEGMGRAPTLAEARAFREECERSRRREPSSSEMREQELRDEVERLRQELSRVKDDLDRARFAREVAESRVRYLEQKVAPPEEMEKRWREELREDLERRYGRKVGEAERQAERLEARVRELEMENRNLRSLIETLKVQEARVFSRQVEFLEKRKAELEAQVRAAEWALEEAQRSGDGAVRGLRFYRVLEESSRALLRALPELEALAEGAVLPEAYAREVLDLASRLGRVARLASRLASCAAPLDRAGEPVLS
jgi:ParB family chromosome partitioning protein